jgi:hypothetical protein
MTDYNDVPQASGLYQNRQNVTYAIGLIDSGGVVITFTVGSQPATSGGTAGMAAVTPVSITVPDASADLMASARAWLVQRQADLDTQLAALGVSNPPPPNPPDPPAARAKT